MLGVGVLGKVLKGTYTPQSGPPVPCAIKTLKTDIASSHNTEIIEEADAMAGLEHPYIVRLIGMCMLTCAWVCVCVHVRVCMYVCICVYMCVYYLHVY